MGRRSTVGWRVRRSIASELEVATSYLRNPAGVPKCLVDLAKLVPRVWIEELKQFDAFPEQGDQLTFEYLGRWAGILEIEDYEEAATAMRALTVDDAVYRMAKDSGLDLPAGLTPVERLIEVELRMYDDLASKFGFYPSADASFLERERGYIRAAASVLRSEPLHGPFWYWMNRFYYEAYRPWRQTRLGAIAALEQEAVAGLGGKEGSGPPELSWLPPDNSLVSIPSVRAAAEAGAFDVVFWAEPFGLSSAINGTWGRLMTSFAANGIDLEYSSAVSEGLAARLKAIGDPTRLSILRMIRLWDADNTQIAGFLGVSRPTVSVHAKVLSDAGLVTTTRLGRQARHTFHLDAVRELCDELLRYLDVPADR